MPCGLELGFHRSLKHSVWNQIFFAYDLLLLLSPILIGVLSPSVIGNHSFVKTSATMALGVCDPKSVGADRLEWMATIIANKILFKRVIFTTFSILAGKKQQTYVQNRTRVAKVASYETSQETSVSCTQLVVLYAPFQFGSEYNFLAK